MAIDLSSEAGLGLAQAARHLPPGRNGRPTHPATLVRWIVQGARAADGRRVHLEAVRLGARWVTSAAALQRFAEALAGRPAASHEPGAVHRAVERQLDRIGL
jgi:hypothetical protein